MDGHCSYLIRTQPVRQIVLTATTFNPTTPPRPRPSHSPKVNATTQNALGWWARRRTPTTGTTRHTAVPNAAATHQPPGRKASNAPKHRRRRAAPKRSGGVAPQPGQPHPHRFSASPPRRNPNTDVDHTQRSSGLVDWEKPALPENSHAIPLGQFSTCRENVGIVTV